MIIPKNKYFVKNYRWLIFLKSKEAHLISFFGFSIKKANQIDIKII